ncbi:hypothetical protein RF11_10550 [Thelohanellus kitauei]|uniref:Uncharacterized protein n=1 Tax=Thelohanellus kitauei TaxID=669202 RepID=A0A0C2J152_THEKT|nr:hypothetical protein RF11_10550 [Thelohanellus kitauei]
MITFGCLPIKVYLSNERYISWLAPNLGAHNSVEIPPTNNHLQILRSRDSMSPTTVRSLNKFKMIGILYNVLFQLIREVIIRTAFFIYCKLSCEISPDISDS